MKKMKEYIPCLKMIALALLLLSEAQKPTNAFIMMPPTTQRYRGNKMLLMSRKTPKTEDVWEQLPLMRDIMGSSNVTVPLVFVESTSILPTPSDNSIYETAITPSSLARLAICGMISFTLVLYLEGLTMQFEAVQAWRYMWPLVGIVYILAPLLGLYDNWTRDSEESISSTRLVASTVSLLGGIGLLVGGYMDAFFPVWYSSPDLLGTRTGLESDSAAILLLLTTTSVISNVKHQLSIKQILVFAVLFAQLYEMGSYTFTAWGEWLLQVVPVLTG